MKTEKEIREMLKKHERYMIFGKSFLFDDRMVQKVLKWVLED